MAIYLHEHSFKLRTTLFPPWPRGSPSLPFSLALLHTYRFQRQVEAVHFQEDLHRERQVLHGGAQVHAAQGLLGVALVHVHHGRNQLQGGGGARLESKVLKHRTQKSRVEMGEEDRETRRLGIEEIRGGGVREKWKEESISPQPQVTNTSIPYPKISRA